MDVGKFWTLSMRIIRDEVNQYVDLRLLDEIGKVRHSAKGSPVSSKLIDEGRWLHSLNRGEIQSGSFSFGGMQLPQASLIIDSIKFTSPPE